MRPHQNFERANVWQRIVENDLLAVHGVDSLLGARELKQVPYRFCCECGREKQGEK